MATIQIKRSTGGDVQKSTTGELAYAFTVRVVLDQIHYSSDLNNLVVGGKKFTDMFDHTIGTLTTKWCIITDANSKIDSLKLKVNNSTPGNGDNDGTYSYFKKHCNSLKYHSYFTICMELLLEQEILVL